MACAALSRAMRKRPHEESYIGKGALYGNNLVSLYQLSSIYVGRNWVDQ